jgi:hypothetical protein
MRKWLPMIILAMAQFVMVLDSSVMNVAISQIVDDLDTTIQGVQTAITLYMQGILGLDAFETGKRLLPLSVAMFVFALLGPRIAGRRSPRIVAQAGIVAVSIGAVVMLGTLDVKLNDTAFKLALPLIGAGAGLLASQLGNIIMSAVAQQTIAAHVEKGIDIVPVGAVEQAAVDGGLTQDQARAVAADHGDAQLVALRLSLGAVALAALLSLWVSRGLPGAATARTEATAPSEPSAYPATAVA